MRWTQLKACTRDSGSLNLIGLEAESGRWLNAVRSKYFKAYDRHVLAFRMQHYEQCKECSSLTKCLVSHLSHIEIRWYLAFFSVAASSLEAWRRHGMRFFYFYFSFQCLLLSVLTSSSLDSMVQHMDKTCPGVLVCWFILSTLFF